MKFFNLILPSGGLGRRLLQCLLFWNPLLCTVFSTLFPTPDHWLLGWSTSLVISTTISTICFSGVQVVKEIEKWVLAKLGYPAPVHHGGWYIALSILILIPGLGVGYRAGGLYRAVMGVPWQHLPSLDEYKSGVIWGAAIATLMFLWETRRDARQVATEARRQALQSQVSALTAQMNPHLLFNALNTVASMIPTDPQGAEETVIKLSELYRGVLSSSQKTTHSLERELEICEAYLAVEKARFGSRLRIQRDFDPSVVLSQIEIPALLVQPMVENAVKHGLAPKGSGGTIRLSVRKDGKSLALTVEDDGVGFYPDEKRGTGSGSALQNCRDRLQLLYGDQARLEIGGLPSGGTRVLMKIPREAHA